MRLVFGVGTLNFVGKETELTLVAATTAKLLLLLKVWLAPRDQ